MNKYLLKVLEDNIKDIINSLEYDIDSVSLITSSRKDLGQFQFNGSMKLAGIYHQNPFDIASKIADKLKETNYYSDVNVSKPGFINLTINNDTLINYLNDINNDMTINNGIIEKKKILIDYGGPNVAKALHVGHLRPHNIGQSLKGLARALGCEVIGDIHLGDWGRPMGLVILEIKKRYPDLVFFNKDYNGSYDGKCPVTNKDLEELYPIASAKAKEDEEYLNEAREITTKLQHKEKGYYDLWKEIVKLSVEDTKKIHKQLNVDFELWNGESDADEFVETVIKYLEDNNYAYMDDGALIMDVKEAGDKLEIPPVILKTSKGGVTYQTTDIATLYDRAKENYDEIWYITDGRQALHFNQVFRAVYKSGIISKNTKLIHLGIGTMNGKDGKPFKTRDGGVMTLQSLINLVSDKAYLKLNNNNISEEEKKCIAKQIGVANLKYADLIPNIVTDYIFDEDKISDVNGKTGVYLLYSTIRIKSLLDNAKTNNISYNKISKIDDNIRNITLMLLNYPKVLEKCYYSKSLNELTDYIYNLTSGYNTFYQDNKILIEKDESLRESWLVLSSLVYRTNKQILDILGIILPKKI